MLSWILAQEIRGQVVQELRRTTAKIQTREEGTRGRYWSGSGGEKWPDCWTDFEGEQSACAGAHCMWESFGLSYGKDSSAGNGEEDLGGTGGERKVRLVFR